MKYIFALLRKELQALLMQQVLELIWWFFEMQQDFYTQKLLARTCDPATPAIDIDRFENRLRHKRIKRKKKRKRKSLSVNRKEKHKK